jgi:hypothetical protein
MKNGEIRVFDRSIALLVDEMLYWSDRFRFSCNVDRRISGSFVHRPCFLCTLELVFKDNAESICTVRFPHVANFGVDGPPVGTMAARVCGGSRVNDSVVLPGLDDLEDIFES